jgi:hypothetical protein
MKRTRASSKSYVDAGIRANRVHPHAPNRNFQTGYDIRYNDQPIGRITRLIKTDHWVAVPLISDGTTSRPWFPKKRPPALVRDFETRYEAIEALVKHQIAVSFVQ